MRTYKVINKCAACESESEENGWKGPNAASLLQCIGFCLISCVKDVLSGSCKNVSVKLLMASKRQAATFGQPHLISWRTTTVPCLIWLLGIPVTSLFCVACGRKEGSGRKEVPQKQV